MDDYTVTADISTQRCHDYYIYCVMLIEKNIFEAQALISHYTTILALAHTVSGYDQLSGDMPIHITHRDPVTI